MKVSFDKEADVLYIKFQDGQIDDSDEQQPGVIFDFDAKGNVVGIEILDASRRVAKPSVVELDNIQAA